MKCIISPYNSCYKNIASEEFLLSPSIEDDIFYLYINNPSIIVGNNQNTYAEINQAYVKEHGIDVVRRRSGGGAVYHDRGNLNFGFIFKNTGKDINAIFKEFTLPVLDVLRELGVNGKFSGRNDLTIDGCKFSGNAQLHTAGKVLIHGTLLFDSNLAVIAHSLNASPLKFAGKSVNSVKSRVTNIRPYLKKELTIEEFSDAILSKVFEFFPGSCRYTYTAEEDAAIEKLAAEKYASWEWTFGNSPEFTYHHLFRYEMGTVEIYLNVIGGIIQSASIFGDFFGKNGELTPIVQALRNIPYTPESLENALSNILVSDYISGLSNGRLIEECFAENKEGETA